MIKVIDALMGTGKTSAAINMINNSAENKRYIFATPYLKEVDRIKAACKAKQFRSPHTKNVKYKEFVSYVKAGNNIATTHQIVSMIDRETARLIAVKGYTLVMDEAMEAVRQAIKGYDDLSIAKDACCKVDEEGYMHWTEKYEGGCMSKIKQQCDEGRVICCGNAFIRILPRYIFDAFAETYVLTYMFDAQILRYYCDYMGIQYEPLYVVGNSPNTYQFTERYVQQDYSEYTGLIDICQNEKMNEVGNKWYYLSQNWYKGNMIADTGKIDEMRRNLGNFFKNICKTNSKLNLWTVYKQFKSSLSGNGYVRGFASVNIRATNDFSQKTSVAYPINWFTSPVITRFFAEKGITVDQNADALSMMLQYIFRSAIRNKQAIKVYVPSCRMRRLLETWIRSIAVPHVIVSDNSPQRRFEADKTVGMSILSFSGNKRRERAKNTKIAPRIQHI